MIYNFRLAARDQRDAFGMIVSYAVKVKLSLGALGGEISAELPFVLMHPKVHFTGVSKMANYRLVLQHGYSSYLNCSRPFTFRFSVDTLSTKIFYY